MDKEILKSLFYDYWKNIVVFVLAFLLFKSCQTNNEVQLANNDLKKEVKDITKELTEKNKDLQGKIGQLEKKKQKTNTKIAYIQNKAKKEIEKVAKLSTIQLADFYAKRYDNEPEITENGVILIDTVAKQNIIELMQKDLCESEIEFVKDNLKITEQQSMIKDTIIDNFGKSLTEHQKVMNEIIKNTEKSLRKEKVKKNFWKLTSGAILIGAGYLLVK